jgi:hypothetical protein
MSSRSGRKKIAQGEASVANGALGIVIIKVQSPLQRTLEIHFAVIPGFRASRFTLGYYRVSASRIH